MKIYRRYMDPPEPPPHLWLTIDFSKIDFKDLEHIKLICNYIPETYTTLNNLYKVYKKNREAYLKVSPSFSEVPPPKIMKKPKEIKD